MGARPSLAAIALFFAAACVPASAAVTVGKPFPPLSIVAPDGAAIEVPDGDQKPTALVFFASWCGPCRQEMPNVVASYRRYGERIHFVGIDVFEPDEKAAGFVRDLNVPFPVVTRATAPPGFFRSGLVLPMTMLLAGDGVVRDMWAGYDERGPFFGHLFKVGINN